MDKKIIFIVIPISIIIFILLCFMPSISYNATKKVVLNNQPYVTKIKGDKILELHQDNINYYLNDDNTLTVKNLINEIDTLHLNKTIYLKEGNHFDYIKGDLIVKDICLKPNLPVKKLFIDKGIEVNLNDLLDNNKTIEKVFINDETLVKDLKKEYKTKVYYYNESSSDVNYSIPNLIYSLNIKDDSSDYIYFDDYNNETIKELYQLDRIGFKGWYLDKECTIPYYKDLVINNKTILYAKLDSWEMSNYE